MLVRLKPLQLFLPKRQQEDRVAVVIQQVILDEQRLASRSLCFALATGVGKTRLMGAFISRDELS